MGASTYSHHITARGADAGDSVEREVSLTGVFHVSAITEGKGGEFCGIQLRLSE
jgi:hypothetical protein